VVPTSPGEVGSKVTPSKSKSKVESRSRKWKPNPEKLLEDKSLWALFKAGLFSVVKQRPSRISYPVYSSNLFVIS
jgi:hypothetical protein